MPPPPIARPPSAAPADAPALPPAHPLAHLGDFLKGRIRGQDRAVEAIARAVQRSELGLAKPDRPRSSFILFGPTGVGKTESTLSLCQFLFGDGFEGRFHRFDMAEFQTAQSLELLLGRDRDEQGLLGDAVDRIESRAHEARRNSGNPHQASGILLFDEIEKADKKFQTVFLSALDAARVTMSNGTTKNLSGFYLFFTSNLGSAETIHMDRLPYAALVRHVITQAEAFFKPEVLARFSERVVFNRLSWDVQLQIAGDMLAKELRHLHRVLGIELEAPPEVFQYVVKRGYDKKLGARPMRSAIERELGDAMTAFLLHNPGPPPPFLRLRVLPDGTRLYAEAPEPLLPFPHHPNLGDLPP